jgi:hypothetical protein
MFLALSGEGKSTNSPLQRAQPGVKQLAPFLNDVCAKEERKHDLLTRLCGTDGPFLKFLVGRGRIASPSSLNIRLIP